jgi:hypothetical protein
MDFKYLTTELTHDFVTHWMEIATATVIMAIPSLLLTFIKKMKISAKNIVEIIRSKTKRKIRLLTIIVLHGLAFVGCLISLIGSFFSSAPVTQQSVVVVGILCIAIVNSYCQFDSYLTEFLSNRDDKS